MKVNKEHSQLEQHLKYLKLPFIRDHYQDLAAQAARKNWAHVDYLDNLVSGEAALRRDRSIERRIRMARFPLIKTLDQFNWAWPKQAMPAIFFLIDRPGYRRFPAPRYL